MRFTDSGTRVSRGGRRSVRTGAAACLVLFGLATPAVQGEEQSDSVSEREMAAFAAAARELQVMRGKARLPVGRAVRKRMVEAVRERGLTVDRYNRIARQVRQDTGLNARYRRAWRELGG
ncbi:DUF4168 domain-containing protein [Thiohalorhabdus sp. Cl-TMA]|uniref:DUF4168 domain-containing protein n=1 Tax=Thiohalorhabdus methylotrophus TaxID=3242694 RepID=A0ABV4TVV7_9GAMM